jgi:5-(carboxyamino)imidazole ribonucleotide synthase
MILPGATLGVLGGGQLGRMFVLAARTLGYRVVVLDPDPYAPAGQVADEHLSAPYTDSVALARLAACDAVTTEFENVPAEALARVVARCEVRPPPAALALTQDRSREKAFVHSAGLATVEYADVRGAADLDAAWLRVGGPAILKRTVLGYDGKGQAAVSDRHALDAGFEELGRAACVLEERVDLKLELSVVLARAANGETSCFPVAENIHRNGILDTSIVPARIAPDIEQEALRQAVVLAEAMDYVGVLAVEFFLTADDRLLVNELAPRPHNSGHYTLDACVTSQFEQQVRVLCDLPLGDTRQHSPAVMVNLLGDLWRDGEPNWAVVFADPAAKLHLYGKHEARPGRKMGHFTLVDDDVERALERAEAIMAQLGGR